MKYVTPACKMTLVLFGLCAMLATCQRASASVQCDTAGATMLLPLTSHDGQILSDDGSSDLFSILALNKEVESYRMAVSELNVEPKLVHVASYTTLSAEASTKQIARLAAVLSEKCDALKFQQNGNQHVDIRLLNESMSAIAASEKAISLHLLEIDKAIDTATPEDRAIYAGQLDRVQMLIDKLQEIHSAIYSIKCSKF